jgi:hypothetical protein
MACGARIDGMFAFGSSSIAPPLRHETDPLVFHRHPQDPAGPAKILEGFVRRGHRTGLSSMVESGAGSTVVGLVIASNEDAILIDHPAPHRRYLFWAACTLVHF